MSITFSTKAVPPGFDGRYGRLYFKTVNTELLVSSASVGGEKIWKRKDYKSSIGFGSYYTVLVKFDGTCVVTGNNTHGGLGLGGTTSTETNTYIPIPGISDCVSVACGTHHTIFVLADGRCYGTGNNTSGQLGLGANTGVSVPTLIPDIVDCVGVACGDYHTVFLFSDGTCKSCGKNDYGQLGIGNTTNVNVPTSINIADCTKVIAGGNTSFFIVDTMAKLFATGINKEGTLGVITGATGGWTDNGTHSYWRETSYNYFTTPVESKALYVWNYNYDSKAFDLHTDGRGTVCLSYTGAAAGVSMNDGVLIYFNFGGEKYHQYEYMVLGTPQSRRVVVCGKKMIFVSQDGKFGTNILPDGTLNSTVYDYDDGTRIVWADISNYTGEMICVTAEGNLVEYVTTAVVNSKTVLKQTLKPGTSGITLRMD